MKYCVVCFIIYNINIMRQGLYDKLSNKCKNTINLNNPVDSINIISEMKLPCSNSKIGMKDALKIYNIYSDESVEYKSSKYKNNINKYKDKVKENVNIANNLCNN
jgi:hypothetical protein